MLNTAIFPDKLSIAKIKPIHKNMMKLYIIIIDIFHMWSHSSLACCFSCLFLGHSTNRLPENVPEYSVCESWPYIWVYPSAWLYQSVPKLVLKCGSYIWTKYSDQTNFEPKVLYERNHDHWNVFKVRFAWFKYLGVAAFLRSKYQNSLVIKIYKRRSHHVTCLANISETAR